MKSKLVNLSALLTSLMEMRKDLKLHTESDAELAVIAALSEMSGKSKNSVHIQQLRNHDLVKNLPKPTVYNALNRLIAKGFCTHLGSERSGLYQLEKFIFK